MIIIGLTGSIGMGKSTTAELFSTEGIPVQNADEVVHNLYAGRAAPLVEAAFPGSTKDGIVDRQSLGKFVIGKPDAMKKLEAIIHPMVAEEREKFLNEAEEAGSVFALLDIPLLFETGGDKYCDFIVVVTTSAEEQRKRVLSRPGMSVEKFESILASQIPDSEKRKRADYLVDTSFGVDAAREQVIAIIEAIIAGVGKS